MLIHKGHGFSRYISILYVLNMGCARCINCSWALRNFKCSKLNIGTLGELRLVQNESSTLHELEKAACSCFIRRLFINIVGLMGLVFLSLSIFSLVAPLALFVTRQLMHFL